MACLRGVRNTLLRGLRARGDARGDSHLSRVLPSCAQREQSARSWKVKCFGEIFGEWRSKRFCGYAEVQKARRLEARGHARNLVYIKNANGCYGRRARTDVDGLIYVTPQEIEREVIAARRERREGLVWRRRALRNCGLMRVHALFIARHCRRTNRRVDYLSADIPWPGFSKMPQDWPAHVCEQLRRLGYSSKVRAAVHDCLQGSPPLVALPTEDVSARR